MGQSERPLFGFQSLSCSATRRQADIATFARMAPSMKGTALFPATRKAAEDLGLKANNAAIRCEMGSRPVTGSGRCR